MNIQKLAVLLLGFILISSFPAESWGADWQLYGYNDLSRCYYDRESTKEISTGVFRVWEKVEWLPKGVGLYVERMGQRYRELSHSLRVTEINCKDGKRRLVSVTIYKQGGGTLDNVDYEAKGTAKWSYVPPKSLGEKLLRSVCK